MKRIISALLALTLVLGMLPVYAVAADGKPEKIDGVYQLATAQDLLWFAETVNGGDTNISAVLTEDIDLTGTEWPGIGVSENKFGGSFDGQNHTVTFKDASVGLFGYVLGGSNKLVTIQNVRTSGSIHASGIADHAGYAKFTRCINGATITSALSCIGGIVGRVTVVQLGNGVLTSDVQINECGNEASITASSSVGGIVGIATANTKITYCYNTGNITGKQEIGGLAGYLQATNGTTYVKSSYNTGTVFCSIVGQKITGGIVGHMHNTVTVSNCYNSGISDYAIAGSRYNYTARIENCYYLGINSYKCSPDFFETEHHAYKGLEINTRATARTAKQMESDDMALLLKDGFQPSCPSPVLTWQTVVTHTENAANCPGNKNEQEKYWVTFQESSLGLYTVKLPDMANPKATQGKPYTFEVHISGGCQMNDAFKVKVNGEVWNPDVIHSATDETSAYVEYTVAADKVTGPLSITVFGVEQLRDWYAIKHPASGYGFTVEVTETDNQKFNSVRLGKDFEFTLRFKHGFKPGSKTVVSARPVVDDGTYVEPVELEYSNNGDGTYTYVIPAVNKNYEILVSGIEAYSDKTVTVNFSVSHGFDKFYIAPGTETRMLDISFTVPYFDLGLYGLSQYYYNPYCYKDENGNPQGIQRAGTPEVAYEKITLMHAFIVATELYRLNIPPQNVGKGYSDVRCFTSGDANSVVSWTQGPGSSFMKFWNNDTNLNYYQNYEYPLGAPGWGSTSDQILIKDGDDISIHLIEGAGSGSRFGIFTVNDKNTQFNQKTKRDEAEIYQNQKMELTLYWTNTSGDYRTLYEKIPNQKLVWANADNLTSVDIDDWNETGLPRVATREGDEEPAQMVTDENGKILIDATGVKPGTYYIAARGFFTEGGEKDNAGFVSAGAEAGAAVFKLTVHEFQGILGDVNGDFVIDVVDAGLVLQYVAKLIDSNDIDVGSADVNTDSVVDVVDAGLILQYVAKLITSFTGNS